MVLGTVAEEWCELQGWAGRGVWPGGAVEGVCFVHKGRLFSGFIKFRVKTATSSR
jgi:hypothetical protein